MTRRTILAMAAAVPAVAQSTPSVTLPKLAYATDALEPFIDARTMEIHHDKHHQAYVDNLNKALATRPELSGKPIDKLIGDLAGVPEPIRAAVRNNGGGHLNHSLFWQTWVSPRAAPRDDSKRPSRSRSAAKRRSTTSCAPPDSRSSAAAGSGVCRRAKTRYRLDLAQSGQSLDDRQYPFARPRCLGARLLPEVPESPRRLSRSARPSDRMGFRLATL